jgi:hypothetical protein
MGSLVIGLVMMGAIFAVIGFIFYKASPLPKPDTHQSEIENSQMGG